MLEVCVIGAGPAGSLVAIYLARRGASITLVEQHRFPRDKVCGECISALGWEVLERAQLGRRMRAVKMTRGLVHDASGNCGEIQLPGPMWGISRAMFDAMLLDAAREAGVKVLQPARCEGIVAGVKPKMRFRRLEDNSIDTFEADVIVLADGKCALVDLRPQPTEDFGIKAHFELLDVPRDAVQLFGVKSCYGGIAPIENGRFNIAFSVTRERIERARNVEAVFAEMVGENRGLARCMDGAKRVSEWLAAPLPRFGVRSSWPQGIIPIGNAAAAIEPIGGEGIGLALRSAEMAADAIVGCADLNITRDKLQRGFRALWRPRRLLWRAVAMLVSRPALCEFAVSVLNATSIGERVVRLGKVSPLPR